MVFREARGIFRPASASHQSLWVPARASGRTANCEMAWNRFATNHRMIRSLCGVAWAPFGTGRIDLPPATSRVRNGLSAGEDRYEPSVPFARYPVSFAKGRGARRSNGSVSNHCSILAEPRDQIWSAPPGPSGRQISHVHPRLVFCGNLFPRAPDDRSVQRRLDHQPHDGQITRRQICSTVTKVASTTCTRDAQSQKDQVAGSSPATGCLRCASRVS